MNYIPLEVRIVHRFVSVGTKDLKLCSNCHIDFDRNGYDLFKFCPNCGGKIIKDNRR